MRYAFIAEPLVYVVAFTFGAWRGSQELHATLTESVPTPIDIERFAADIRGQRWVALRGRLAVEHHQVQASFHEVHRQQNLSHVRVPVVPAGWQPDQPVEAVAVFGPFAAHEVDRWLKQHTGQPAEVVDGMTVSDVYDFPRLFPGLRSATSVVYLNVGSRPASLEAGLFFLGICVISLILLIRAIHRELKSE